jgi:hypothetical protein
MGHDSLAPWHDPVVCGVCDRQLVPPSYSITADYCPNGSHPNLKCPGCGVRYQWQRSAQWVPLLRVGMAGRGVRMAPPKSDG